MHVQTCKSFHVQTESHTCIHKLVHAGITAPTFWLAFANGGVGGMGGGGGDNNVLCLALIVSQLTASDELAQMRNTVKTSANSYLLTTTFQHRINFVRCAYRS